MLDIDVDMEPLEDYTIIMLGLPDKLLSKHWAKSLQHTRSTTDLSGKQVLSLEDWKRKTSAYA